VSLPVKATAGDGLTFTAKGLPPGLSISRTGVISGTPHRVGTRTVTVTARDATGTTGSVTFVWTPTRPARH